MDANPTNEHRRTYFDAYTDPSGRYCDPDNGFICDANEYTDSPNLDAHTFHVYSYPGPYEHTDSAASYLDALAERYPYRGTDPYRYIGGVRVGRFSRPIHSGGPQ
jgi:hypothetical protein